MASKPADPAEGKAEDKPEDIPQNDGAAEPFGGSQLQEPQYAVEIKLADMQADPNNPLYSAATFEQLGLYVEYSIGKMTC
jgi:ATP-dependent RNA helicase DDX19/DBP5